MQSIARKSLRLIALSSLVLGATQATALDVYLRAGTTTNTMPDGRQVLMWGFSLEGAAGTATNLITSPGPSLSVPVGDSTLNVYVTNTLPEPVSIVVPGQVGATLGNPVRNPDGRVRSFTHEADAATGATSGGFATYTFANVAPGTFLYHSGSHPAVQVQMGLYGALTKLAANGTNYIGAPGHAGEATLLFSEIDPALHDAIAADDYGPGKTMTSTLRYAPQYFFINGVAYTPGMESNSLNHVTFGTNFVTTAARRMLVRLINATPSYRTPVVAGQHVQPYAEDGNPYPTGASTPQQVAKMMAPLKTMDVYWNLDRAGTFPVYDRQLGLGNGSASPGGMIGFLSVGRTISRATAINIPASGNGIAYQASVAVSGLTGVVGRVTLRLNGLTHPRPQDLDIVLRSPSGKYVLVMSDLGGTTAVAGTTLEFDDAATATIGSGPIVSGRYQPQNLAGSTDVFPTAPLNAATVFAPSLSAFNGSVANGTWVVYIRDQVAGPGATTGTLAGGYTLTITPRPE